MCFSQCQSFQYSSDQHLVFFYSINGINHFNDSQFIDSVHSAILICLEKNLSEQGREPTTNATRMWHKAGT